MTPPSPPNTSQRLAHWYRRALPAYWVFLFCATHFPGLDLRAVHADDKLVHAVCYGVLALLLWKCAQTFGPRTGRFAPLALLGLAAYAALDEWSQPYFLRGADPADWLADVAGAAGVLLILELHRRYGARRARGRTGGALDSTPARR